MAIHSAILEGAVGETKMRRRPCSIETSDRGKASSVSISGSC